MEVAIGDDKDYGEGPRVREEVSEVGQIGGTEASIKGRCEGAKFSVGSG
jgi:hypothetical protein